MFEVWFGCVDDGVDVYCCDVGKFECYIIFCRLVCCFFYIGVLRRCVSESGVLVVLVLMLLVLVMLDFLNIDCFMVDGSLCMIVSSVIRVFIRVNMLFLLLSLIWSSLIMSVLMRSVVNSWNMWFV